MSSFRRNPIGSAILGVPPVTLGIVVACIVIWFVQAATWASWPVWSWVSLSLPGLASGRVWQVLTYQFLHDPHGILHILFNMMMLVGFGPRLERRWGSGGLLRFFLTCGAGGGIAYALVALFVRDPSPVVGASGALMGVLVAAALIWPRDRILLFLVIPLELRHAIVIIVLIDLMLAWLGRLGGSATGAVAHLGGALTGWLYISHAWRLKKLMPAGSPLLRARNWWKRRRLKVVDRNFDEWLKQQDDRNKH